MNVNTGVSAWSRLNGGSLIRIFLVDFSFGWFKLCAIVIFCKNLPAEVLYGPMATGCNTNAPCPAHRAGGIRMSVRMCARKRRKDPTDPATDPAVTVRTHSAHRTRSLSVHRLQAKIRERCSHSLPSAPRVHLVSE